MKPITSLITLLFVSGCASSGSSVTGRVPNFIWPVKRGVLTQKFKVRSKKHQGIDLAGQKNTPIYATETGRVLYVGREFSGYGKLVIIEHGSDRWASFYAHLNQFKVKEGQTVAKGQVIGLMGRTGRASGVHLHFEIRYNLRAVDPLNYLSSRSLLSKR